MGLERAGGFVGGAIRRGCGEELEFFDLGLGVGDLLAHATVSGAALAVAGVDRTVAGEHFAYSRSLVGRQERGEGLDEVIVGQIPQFLAAAFGELDAGTRELVRVAERHTVLDEPFGDVGGQPLPGGRRRSAWS